MIKNDNSPSSDLPFHPSAALPAAGAGPNDTISLTIQNGCFPCVPLIAFDDNSLLKGRLFEHALHQESNLPPANKVGHHCKGIPSISTALRSRAKIIRCEGR